MLVTIIVFLVVLTILVVIHEAGHYFVGKWYGIKVEEAALGFPLTPPLFSKKSGETIYSFYPVLIGGFVKLYGEDEAGGGRVDVGQENKVNKEDEDRAFYSKSAGQRALVIFAGVFMNTILAILIYYVFMFMSGFKTELPLLGNHHFFGVDQQVNSQIIISDVSKNSPAAKAGMTALTKVVSVNGKAINTTKEFSDLIKANKGKTIAITWEDIQTNKRASATVVPRINPPANQGSLGVAFFSADTVTLSYDTPIQKVFSGIVHPANLMVYNFAVLKDLVSTSIKEKNATPLSQGVSGPVGIYKVVGEIVSIPTLKARILQLLNLSGLLSISLAFFNVLPIPGLDGGRLFFVLIEAVSGRKVNPKVEGLAHSIGMALLLALLALVTYKDLFVR